MGFTNLDSDSGLATLDSFLADKSYIEGVNASQADVAVFKAVGKAPDASKYANAARWYKQIASYEDEFASLAGDKSVEASSFGPAGSAAAAAAGAAAEDDDVDLFGSSDEEVDEEAEKIKQARLKAYAEKKAAKGPGPVAKSVVTLEVKPWDDETDLEELLANVKAIEMDGLVWGGHQFVEVGYGIKKLQINCVVEDAKVSMDDLQDAIAEDEDHVQSSDVTAMQKL